VLHTVTDISICQIPESSCIMSWRNTVSQNSTSCFFVDSRFGDLLTTTVRDITDQKSVTLILHPSDCWPVMQRSAVWLQTAVLVTFISQMVSLSYTVQHILLFDESVCKKLNDRNEDLSWCSKRYICFWVKNFFSRIHMGENYC